MKNKQTILIVDDIEENVDVLVELLGEYDLVTALDAQTAFSILKEEDIDLILLDIMMPHINGFEACEIIKSNSETSNIPVIFLSAKNDGEDIERGFGFGAVDYITKPFNPKELLSRVNTHLKLRAYEKNLEKRVSQELEKNRFKQQMIHQQSKQAALGELLMHIAHQWKQPLASLSSINTLSRFKIDKGLSITQEELYENICKSEDLICFMSETVDTFKDFYQPSESENYFFITDSITNVLNISNATLEYDKIKITLHSDEDSRCYGNINEFSQVMFSIINNARDIFKQKKISEPRIDINISNQRISISDNGGGVEQSIKNDIFLPYKSTTGGNGIGLYIAKEIIEKNGGVIYVQNNDEGAVFTVELLTWID